MSSPSSSIDLLSRSGRLLVVPSRQQRGKPRITHRPSYTEVKKGETIRLPCGADGFPPPSYAWYKDGGRLSNAHDRYQVSR